MRRDFSVIFRGAEESHGICQWNEDDSWRKLTVGKGFELITKTERMSSTVTEKMKSLNYQREKGISA
jgi:hypothetical protein